MAHGLEVYTAAGATRLAVTDRITRLLLRRSLGASESSSQSVPGFDSARGVAFAVPKITGGMNPLDPRMGHIVSTSGATVTWTASAIASARVASELFVFMYA